MKRGGHLKLSIDGRSEYLKQLRKAKRDAKDRQREQRVEETEPSLEPYEILRDVQIGTGRILTSGTTIHGIGTVFTQELKPSDSLIVRVEGTEERRKVILVLSDKSACVNEPFNQEFNCEFYIQNPPLLVDPKAELEEARKKRRLERQDESKLLKNYEVRVKRGPWSYKSSNILTTDSLSNEDMLNIRAQKVRDKFCWM